MTAMTTTSLAARAAIGSALTAAFALACAGPETPEKASAHIGEASGYGIEPGDFWSHFPADADFVVGLRADALRESEVYRTYRETLESAAASAADESDADGRCARALLADLRAIAIGGQSADPQSSVWIIEGLSRDDVDACARTIAAERGDHLTVRHEGERASYAFDGGPTLRGEWRGERAVLLSGRGDAGARRARVRGEDGLTGDSTLVALAEEPAQSGGLWGAAVARDGTPLASVFQTGQEMGLPRATSLSGALRLAEGAALDVAIGTDSPSDTDEMVAAVEGLADVVAESPTPMAALARALDAEARDDGARLSLEVSAEEAGDALAGLARGDLFGPGAAASESGEIQGGLVGPGSSGTLEPPPGSVGAAPPEEPPSAPGELAPVVEACTGGDMDACDRLYRQSPLGSEEEVWGDTCGGRQAPGTGRWCRDLEGPSADDPLADLAREGAEREPLEEPPADPEHSDLVDACGEGDMDACDVLYVEAASNSAEEAWGDSCGGRQALNTGRWCDADEFEAEVMEFGAQVAEILAEGTDECDAAIARGHELAEDHGELLRRAREIAAEQSEMAQAGFEARYHRQLDAFRDRISEAYQSCGDHDGFSELMERITTEPQ